ncbi:MAG TPA: hypothetical protein VFH31_18165 [Pyrinomonadaceae bacterium]|nr:hypothetical protein [Pyrinomonadaceae bacterium]
MIIRSLTVMLVVLGASTLAFAQGENLLKNPDGDEDSQHWRTFGNAKVERCVDGGVCFVLRDGGYFFQDVAVPESAVGRYALLIGRAHCEPNTSELITGRPYLYGYMMNAGEPSGGRIYAYLSGQQMNPTDGNAGEWKHLWGVFRIQLGTMRIRLFLQQGQRKGVPHDGSRTSFDDLGIYIFPTEQEALAYVAQKTSTIEVGSGKLLDPIAQCPYQRASIPPLYGIQLGMSPEEILSIFPGSHDLPNLQRALEPFKSSKPSGFTIVPVENRKKSPDLNEVREISFHFRNYRLLSFTAHYSSPQWENVDNFIEKRSHLLNLTGVNWNPVEGNSGAFKYIICDGVEIRFYAAPPGTRNLNSISVTDVALETKESQAAKPAHPGQP